MQLDSFHYPPELFELMVSTTSILTKGKESLLLFFRGAGVNETLYNDITLRLKADRNSVKKAEISRIILQRLNEKKDLYIRERREVLKRVVEFESFSDCWPEDQLKAKGLVAEISRIINVKDSFTRMKQEKEKEEQKHIDEQKKKAISLLEKSKRIEILKKDLFSLFGETNPQKRGKKLEKALNDIFTFYGILINEAFTVNGDNKEGIIEQIDGVIEIDNQPFLVEMKWKKVKEKVDNNDIATHLSRVFFRTGVSGLYISSSGYTPSSIAITKEALNKNVLLVLSDLEEFVQILNNDQDLIRHLRAKIKRAQINKEPYFKP